MPIGDNISKSIVNAVMIANIQGWIKSLIAANAKIIYPVIINKPNIIAIVAEDLILSPILGPTIANSSKPSGLVRYFHLMSDCIWVEISETFSLV